jgi:hypothetical protein
VLQALADFYSNSTDLIADAIARAQQRHRDGHADRRAEHGAILAQIRQKEAAIERYHLAFENGTMDDAATTAGNRAGSRNGAVRGAGGTRTHTVNDLNVAPHAYWATAPSCS